MTKEEMVAMLKRSVDEWNEWRKDNPHTIANLDKVDLSNLNLEGIDLHDVTLLEANLSGSNLSNSTISDAYFISANLSSVKLSCSVIINSNFANANMNRLRIDDSELNNVEFIGADLRFSYFVNSKFGKIDFTESNLNGTRFIKSTLTICNFSGAILRSSYFQKTISGYSYFTNVDLREIKGIESIDHQAPSVINSSSFKKSKGQIHEMFLKGYGLSDWEIASIKLYNPKLTSGEITDVVYKIDELRNEQPIQFHNVFFSYSHKNSVFVDSMEQQFDKRGIRFWRDKHDATSGKLAKMVMSAMKGRIVLLILSEQSIKSDWVEFEVKNARKLEREEEQDILCPIALDDSWKTAQWSPILMEQIKEYNILDFSDWQDKSVMNRQVDKLINGWKKFY